MLCVIDMLNLFFIYQVINEKLKTFSVYFPNQMYSTHTNQYKELNIPDALLKQRSDIRIN